jgi:hypothetical protein
LNITELLNITNEIFLKNNSLKMSITILIKPSETKENFTTEKLAAVQEVFTTIIPIPIKLHVNFKHRHSSKTELEVSTVNYDSFLCRINKLDTKLIGTKISDLQVASGIYSKKYNSFLGEQLVLDSEGENIFQYFYHAKNGFINVTHLSEFYSVIIDYPTWEMLNFELIDKYCKATGLNRNQIIMRGAETYIPQGLCVEFMLASSAKYGILLKQMVGAVSELPSTD